MSNRNDRRRQDGDAERAQAHARPWDCFDTIWSAPGAVSGPKPYPGPFGTDTHVKRIVSRLPTVHTCAARALTLDRRGWHARAAAEGWNDLDTARVNGQVSGAPALSPGEAS